MRRVASIRRMEKTGLQKATFDKGNSGGTRSNDYAAAKTKQRFQRKDVKMAYMCKIWQATECNGCGGCMPPEEEEQEDDDEE